MAKPDKVFKQAHDWFREAVSQALSSVPPAQQAVVEKLVWQMLGVVQFNAPVPADPDLTDFKASGATADSLAVATQIAAESLTALEYVKQAVAALQGGNPAAALAVIGPVLQQVDKLRPPLVERYPSAYGLGKMLLALSGDAGVANPAAAKQAEKLAKLLGAASAADLQATQTALAWVTLVTGSMIDRSFTAPVTSAAGWVKQVLPVLTAPVGPMQLPIAGAGLPAGTGIGLRFKADPPTGVEVKMNLGLTQNQALDGSNFQVDLHASAGATAFVPVQPPGPVSVDRDDFLVSVGVSRASGAGALRIGPPGAAASLVVGELGAALTLQNGVAGIDFFARKGKATLHPSGFLKLILGDEIALDFDIEAQADQAGHLRLKNGTGLKATLPAPTLPTGPFKLQFITVGLDPVGGSFLHLQVELSASFGVELGPFQAAVDRLGLLLDLDVNGPHPIDFRIKPPNGIGLSLDAGIVGGGGYLDVDPSGNEYAGVLELKLLVVDVKAIAVLSTRPDVGFSLLLLIYGQFPPVQLSFGFTLTGIGGLIAVQHTTSVTALSQGLGNGSLDAILFPANPVADAPKIIATLRVLFPIKSGGFVIGPMLELGWGTPSLVIVRLGLLIEAGQFVILGQGIVQLPPLVDADLALLRLQVDIVGSVVFDPLRIAFDAKLRNSRVAFLTLTGQFAFRAEFGDHPTFLISAGGFHPRFHEVPSDIPAPFERVGCSFDIGIVGISFKGYFAITSATVQAGSDLRMWADLGVADIEGGYGFDAICYLAPKFYFEVDLHAFVAVHVFGKDFAAIRIEGLLAGPGRWHIAGRGTVELPLVPDYHIHIDEEWGTDRETPSITVALPKLLADEIGKVANWSAQLPRGGEGYVTLADIKGVKDLLAHPLGSLGFRQKLIPLELRLAKVSGSKIDGANEYRDPALVLSQAASPPESQPCDTYKDFFAAAQFLDMSQDDKMAKPSFEAFPAGYVLRNDDYAMGEIVPELLGYEEADLGAERVRRKSRYRSSALFADEVHGAFMQFGAAGRSVLREKDSIQPAEKAAIQVNPVPVTVADKGTLVPAAGATVHQSVWQATQALAFGGVTTPRQSQVVELAELI